MQIFTAVPPRVHTIDTLHCIRSTHRHDDGDPSNEATKVSDDGQRICLIGYLGKPWILGIPSPETSVNQRYSNPYAVTPSPLWTILILSYASFSALSIKMFQTSPETVLKSSP